MPSKLSPRARKGTLAAVLAAASLLGGLAGQADAQTTGFTIGVNNVPMPSWGTARAEGAECPRPISAGEVCEYSGRVWESLVKDDVAYVSGEFSSVAPTIALGGALDGSSGLPKPGFPTLDDGQVKVAAPDGSGGWYVGGTFTKMNQQGVRGVAHVFPDGTLDTAFMVKFPGTGAQPTLTVTSLAMAGNFLYIGGDFTRFTDYGTAGNKPYLARVSKATGALDTAWSAAPDGVVHGIAATGDGRVYFTGDFNNVKGAPAAGGVAAVDGAGNRMSFAPALSGRATSVTVSPDGGRVYVGSNGVTAADGAGNVAWSVPADKPVRSLAVSRSGASVFAGGEFGSMASEAHPRLAAIDAASGAVNTSWNPDVTGPVSTVTVSEDDTTVYVGGDFTRVRNAERRNLAAVDVATGALSSWNPNATGPVATLSASGSLVYAGGDFQNLGAQPRSRLAAIDLTNGGLLSWSPKVENLNADGTTAATLPVVQSMAWAADRNSIYVGGVFSHITGPDGVRVPRENLAQLDLAGNVVAAFHPAEPQGAVRSLAMHGNTLFAGGDFQRLRVSASEQPGHPDLDCGGNPDCAPIGTAQKSTEWKRPGLVAAFDGTTGALDRGFNQVPASTGPGLIGQSGKECTSGTSGCGNGAVKAIAVSPDSRFVYISGTFSDLGGQLGIASLNRSNGSFTEWQPDVTIPIFDLVSGPDGDVYTAAGGGGGKIHRFRQGGACRPGKDSDGKERRWPENPCKPVWEHIYDGDATAVDVSGSVVYGGGHFDFVTSPGGAERHHVAAFSFDGLLARNWYPRLDTNEGVFDITVVPGRMVIVGGNFNRVNPCANPENATEKPCWKAQPAIALFPGNPG